MLLHRSLCLSPRWSSRLSTVFYSTKGVENSQLQHLQCSSDGWVRPTVPKEDWHDNLQHSGLTIMTQATRFSASRPITAEEARSVVLALYRRFFNLRLCFGERNGQRWLRQMQEERIDFEVLHDADPALEYLAMTHRSFDSNSGPMWAARLLPWSDKSVPLENSFISSSQDLAPHDSKHPYLYHLIISYNHAVNDGYTCLIIARTALMLFTRLLAGKSLGEDKQIGDFFDMNKKMQAFNEITQRFVDKPEVLDERKKAAEECLARPLLLDVFPVKSESAPSTDSVYNSLDKEKTKVFTDLCKQNSVTIHTGFCSIINVAIVELLRETSSKRDVYKISSLHFTNERPFFPRSNNSLGFCVGTMSSASEVPDNALANFWSYAKKNHEVIKNRSKSNPSLEEFVLSRTTDFGTKPQFEMLPGMIDPTTYYYGITNMRDTTDFFDIVGKDIDVEWVDGITSIHRGNFMWMHSLYTYRGRFLHSIIYNTGLMDRQTAETIARKISELLENISTCTTHASHTP